MSDGNGIKLNPLGVEEQETAHKRHPNCHEFEVLDEVETCIICGIIKVRKL